MPLSWGDTAKISQGVLDRFRPGSLVSIVGMRTSENAEQARQFEAPIGSNVFLVEFGDGTSLELPEGALEAITQSRGE
jgi:hypothetical protein